MSVNAKRAKSPAAKAPNTTMTVDEARRIGEVIRKEHAKTLELLADA